MTHGRHSAPRHAAPKTALTASPKAAVKGGARRSPTGARRADVPTVTGARKAAPGRRVAERRSPITALRASSELTVAAVAPMAFLSAACVFGLGAGSGQPASAEPGPADGLAKAPTTSTELIGKHRALPSAVASASATTAGTTQLAPNVVAPVAGTQSGTTTPGTTDPTRIALPASSPSAPVATLAPEPTSTPSSSPTSSPTSEPTSTPTVAALTEAEATAQCLASGISALDVAGLAACVDALLH